MDIKFFTPKYEAIPTALRIIIGDDPRKQIEYSRVPDQFAYDFRGICIDDEKEMLDIVGKIAHIMCNQSYDHGSEWRVTSMKILHQKERYRNGTIVRVEFRIKDAY